MKDNLEDILTIAATLAVAILIAIAPICTVRAAETNEVTQAVAQFLAENGWGTTEGLKAVRALRSLYKRETKTEEGRRRWHGARKSVISDAATGNLISTYEDGEVFTDGPTAGKTVTPTATATVFANLPESVKAAKRAAWLAKRQTNEVTVVIRAGGGATGVENKPTTTSGGVDGGDNKPTTTSEGGEGDNKPTTTSEDGE